MKLAILSTLLLSLASTSNGAALSFPANPLCYRACGIIFHNPDQIKLCQDNCNLSSDEASSFIASSTSEERTPSLEEDEDDRASLPPFPADPERCFRVCVAFYNDPDQIEECLNDNCNISSDEASSFVASSTSEERGRGSLSCRDLCNIYHGTSVAREHCYFHCAEDELDASGAFVSEAASVGLRGFKPSEAQTDEYDGFQSDNAVSSFFGCGLCAVIYPNDPDARDGCLRNGGCDVPPDGDGADLDAFDRSAIPQTDTMCNDECDRKYSPQQYIKRILCYHLECTKEDGLTLGDKDAASQPADTVLFKDGPNTDEGSVTCEDICRAVFGGTVKLDGCLSACPKSNEKQLVTAVETVEKKRASS